MRVKELTLHNFRGIKDLHLVFNTQHNVVVLVGVNGVGKSSILDCIILLVKYYKGVCEHHHNFDSTPIDPEKLILDSDINANQLKTINQIEASFDELSVKWKIGKIVDRFPYHTIQSLAKLAALKKTIDKLHKRSTTNITYNEQSNIVYHCFYYFANRQALYFRIFGDDETEDIINFHDFSEWFKDTEDLENERRLSDNLNYRHPVLESVRLATYSLLGQEYNDLRFKRDINKITIKKLEQEIVIDLLSDGEKSLLAMVGNLSRRLSDWHNNLENPLEAEALVLIDEIELHLHPAWQRSIIPRLTKTFPNCQFIVTTHSPQVLSHVDPECIHILDYDGDNVVVKRPENSFGLDSNRILEDILGVPKRPQEIQDEMLELFRSINDNDLERAKEIVQKLGDKIGINEPELVKAEATIKRREIIGR